MRWNWRKTVKVVEEGEVREKRPKTEIGEYMVYDGKQEPIISEELFYAARCGAPRAIVKITLRLTPFYNIVC